MYENTRTITGVICTVSSYEGGDENKKYLEGLNWVEVVVFGGKNQSFYCTDEEWRNHLAPIFRKRDLFASIEVGQNGSEYFFISVQTSPANYPIVKMSGNFNRIEELDDGQQVISLRTKSSTHLVYITQTDWGNVLSKHFGSDIEIEVENRGGIIPHYKSLKKAQLELFD